MPFLDFRWPLERAGRRISAISPIFRRDERGNFTVLFAISGVVVVLFVKFGLIT